MKKNNEKMNQFNNIDWNLIYHSFKINKKDIPNDFYEIMSNCSYFYIYNDDIEINIGSKSAYELIQESFYYNIVPYTIIKIGQVSEYGNLIYSNHSGSFHIYYVKNNSRCIKDFNYLYDSFTELINDNNVFQKILKLHMPLNKKVLEIPMINKVNYGFNSSDFNILKNMIKFTKLPSDFIEIFSYAARFYIDIDQKGYSQTRLTLGDFSGISLYDNFNCFSFMGEHHNITFGIDGYGNSLVYSDKSGVYQIYIVRDSNFEEKSYTYLADNLYELLIDKKNINILLTY